MPFTGTRTLINRLAKELGLNTTVPYRAWFEGKQVNVLIFFLGSMIDGKWYSFSWFIYFFLQVGGWTQVYGNTQLSFASIRGASHEAPATQPKRSLVLFKAFLAGKPLPKKWTQQNHETNNVLVLLIWNFQVQELAFSKLKAKTVYELYIF